MIELNSMGKKSAASNSSNQMKTNKSAAVKRNVSSLTAACNEIATLTEKLDLTIVSTVEKKEAVDKLSSQVGKLASLYDSLVKQQNQDKKDLEHYLNESIVTQRENTKEFQMMIPDISERIDRILLRIDEVDTENNGLRERLLAAADEFENQRTKLEKDMEIISLHQSKQKKQTTKNDGNNEKDEPQVVELKDGDDENMNDINKEKEEDDIDNEEDDIDPAIYAEANASKNSFNNEMENLYKIELDLRKNIISHGEALTKTQNDLDIANKEFYNTQNDLENLVNTLQNLEEMHNKDTSRLALLTSKIASQPSLASLHEEAAKYDRLAEALTKAIHTAM